MAIEFRCTQCDRLLRVPGNTAGKPAQCPGCGGMMTIPGGPAGAAGEMHMTGFRPQAGAAFSPAAGGAYPSSAPQPQPAGDSDNPYQSPLQYGEAPPSAGMSRAGTPAGRVIAPAVGLIAVAVLEIEILAITVVGALAGFAERGGPGPAGVPAFLGPALVLALAVLGVVLSVVVIAGAMKMKNLESRGFAIAAAVVAMLPLFWPCFLLGLPLGIWALVVLCDPQVKPLFGTGTPYVY